MSHFILLVEDDDAIREGVSALLQWAGYSVESFDSGARALEHVVSGHMPDLVLLDLLLRPDMNGWQFLEELRKDPRLRDIPVVAMTAADLAPHELRQARADAILSKPFDFEELKSMVGRFVEPPSHPS
jgi:CheY-like chemotaxis protein